MFACLDALPLFLRAIAVTFLPIMLARDNDFEVKKACQCNNTKYLLSFTYRTQNERTRSTQPSIPPGSVNEYQLWLGRQRQVWLILIADECVGVQVKL